MKEPFKFELVEGEGEHKTCDGAVLVGISRPLTKEEQENYAYIYEHYKNLSLSLSLLLTQLHQKTLQLGELNDISREDY